MTHEFEMNTTGPFDLLYESQFFGGWLTTNNGNSIVLAMPIEGWHNSAAVVLSQREDRIHGLVYGEAAIAEKAWQQALACLSLDIDGSAWEEVGKRDEFIGALQKEYHYLRPVLFYSPFEAAVGLLIGHRISIRQRRTMMQHMAKEYGEPFVIDGQTYYAFPDPHKLLTISTFPGLNDEKMLRIHGAAKAALDGLLDREYLRSLPPEEALERLLELRGVGAFYSEGILYRGAGLVTDITRDINTRTAIQQAYELEDLPNNKQIDDLLEKWQPYPMWCTVLLHVWMRRERGGFSMAQSNTSKKW